MITSSSKAGLAQPTQSEGEEEEGQNPREELLGRNPRKHVRCQR